MLENDWKRVLYKQKLKGRSRYRFLELGVIKTSDRWYKSVPGGPFFSDFDIKTLSTESIKEVYDLYLLSIEEIRQTHPIDLLAFLDKIKKGTVGAIRYSIALSTDLKLPQIIVRPWKELTSERIKIPPGIDIKDKNIVLITDHITTSREVSQAVNDIQNTGGKVTDIITHTIITDFFKETPGDHPKIHAHHKLPDDLPYELKNSINHKQQLSQ